MVYVYTHFTNLFANKLERLFKGYPWLISTMKWYSYVNHVTGTFLWFTFILLYKMFLPLLFTFFAICSLPLHTDNTLLHYMDNIAWTTSTLLNYVDIAIEQLLFAAFASKLNWFIFLSFSLCNEIMSSNCQRKDLFDY